MAEPDPSLTPEKRLLQLIEGGGRDESSAKTRTAPRESPFKKLQELFSVEGMTQFLEDQKESWSSTFKNRRDFLNLRGLNKIAKVITVGLAIFLLISMVYEIKVVNSDYVSNLQIPQREMADISLSDKKIFDTNLLRDAEKLNVFVPVSKRETKKEEKEDEMSLKLVSMIKDWKLAGISIYPSHPERTFCMIEDLQKNTTTFLKVGDTLSGLKIDKINPDSVVLRFNEETIELR